MPRPTELFPEIEPYNTGFLKTDDGHEVYFEESGNPNGYPVLIFHGGPGAGCDPKDRRYFDPHKARVIIFDQRGCGRSRPLGNLHNNTTRRLAKDAKRILAQLEVKKAILSGGSWGSTLALIFAILYPDLAAGMVLRGIYLGEKDEIDYSANGLIAQHFPEAWERFTKNLTPAEKEDPLGAYYHYLMRLNNNMLRDREMAYEWARFEDIHLHLVPPSPESFEKEFSEYPPSAIVALTMLELYYIYNGCFMPNGYIISNIDRIPKNIPISILHGRYDVICPPKNAYRLARAFNRPDVKLEFVFSGHSKSDSKMRKKLISETDEMLDKISS